MSDALTLFVVEVRRCLARRLVWVLVGLAVVASVATGFIVFANTANQPDRPPSEPGMVCEPVRSAPDQPPQMVCRNTGAMEVREGFKLTDLWPIDGSAPALAISVVFLAIGGLLGGASMVGAEWRAGTMTTVLTWEPRRVRLAVAKLAAVVVLAWAIAMALQVLLVLVLVPAAVANGSTEGVDAEWVRVLAGGIFRGGALTAMAALVGGAIAMLGRNTAAALGAGFAYMMIGENLVRAWKPWLGNWLLAENGVVFVTAGGLSSGITDRGFWAAALTLTAYTLGLAAAAVATFRLRDVASSS